MPNPIDAATCRDCGAQLRDPDEDDLFTTVATENAQVVDLNAPRVKDSLWSTDAPPEEDVAEEVVPPSGPREPTAGTEAPRPQPQAGPFSSTGREAPPTKSAPTGAQVFGAGSGNGAGAGNGSGTSNAPGAGSSPFSGTDRPAPRNPFSAPVAEPAPEQRSEPGAGATPGADPFAATAPAGGSGAQVAPEQRVHRITHDQHGLSVAVENLSPADRDRCAVPIAVCGGLLTDQEVVFGLVAGHLLGHSAVLLLTNQRVLVANARRWKPLVDQFEPGADLVVHLRHDRDIASITLVQGERLTGIDDIGDVTMAVDLAERIRAVSSS